MSVCANCHLFTQYCNAECCGVVPIDKDVYERNKEKIQRPIADMRMASIPNHIIPYTEDAKCVFLNKNNRCEIYNERPAGCRFFGNEQHPALFCRFQTKSGMTRSKKSFNEVSEKQHKRALKYLRIKENEK